MESVEIQKLMKLKVLEQELFSLLEKIDIEINQTGLEWLHLKSIAEEKCGVPKLEYQLPGTSSKLGNQTNPNYIDDDSVNVTELDLTVGSSKTFEESDED